MPAENILGCISFVIIDLRFMKKLDVIAVLIAALAFGYSVYEHSRNIEIARLETERAVKLEIEKSMPFLQLEFDKSNYQTDKGIFLYNIGAGPASIVSFKYYVDEEAFSQKVYYGSWIDKGDFLLFTKDSIVFEELNVLYPGYIIPSGRDNEIFLLRDNGNNFYNTVARQDMEKLIIEIEYNSLSSLDTNTYFVRFCEKFKRNNMRSRSKYNLYE